MERTFQLQEKKNNGLKHSSDLKAPISVEKNSGNPLHSTILSMQKTYGNQYVRELVSGERMACPELCGLKGPLTLSPTRPAAQFKPHSCDSCLFHPQRSVKRVATGDSNPSGGISLQTKLEIGQPGDVYEQEADRVADMVLQRRCSTPECEEEEKIRPMRISPLQISPSIQMQKEIEEEEKEMFQVKQTSGVIEKNEDTIGQILQQKGSGRPLEPEVREFMESRFGYDFGDVRIHTDSHGVETSKKLEAEAFTVGKDVYFGSGRYNPVTNSGQRLLAHELTHVMQQRFCQDSSLQIQRIPMPIHENPFASPPIVCRRIQELEDNNRYCKDTFWGGLLHPGQTCFREAVPPATPGRHICLRDSNCSESSHTDAHSPVEFREENGDCNYEMSGAVLTHLYEDVL